jgi:hypothetical protein
MAKQRPEVVKALTTYPKTTLIAVAAIVGLVCLIVGWAGHAWLGWIF